MDGVLVRNCLQEVKRQIKRKSITYADIGERMGVSEVTVKRMFNSDDITLSRLTVLADTAGYSLSGLIAKAEESMPEVKCFTTQQDQAFVRHPHLFHYLMKLHEFNQSPDEVAKHFDLDDLSTYLYLRKLEDLGLLELRAGNQIKMSNVPMLFSPDSQFVRRGIAWSLEQATKALLDKDDRVADLSILYLPAKQCGELMQDIEKVFVRFMDRQTNGEWGNSLKGDIRQVVTFSYAVTSKYPEHDIIRVRDGDLS